MASAFEVVVGLAALAVAGTMWTRRWEPPVLREERRRAEGGRRFWVVNYNVEQLVFHRLAPIGLAVFAIIAFLTAARTG